MSTIGSFLQGTRIVDLSQYIPGPLASLMLVDMGADVIKIEPPSGDPMQTLGPRGGDGSALFYETLNAGKSILHLDLKDPKQLELCIDLIRDCDVLIEGFRPGVMRRLELDYETLRSVNTRLIYCSINGYGAVGSQSQRAGHDANYLAEAGVLDRNGSTRPMFFDPPIADLSGSLFAAMAILGALNGRHRTGDGCHIDLALADVIMPLQMLQIADYAENGTVPQRGETYLNGGAAYYTIYETSDGEHVVVGAVEPKFWRMFCQAAGCPQWIERQGEQIPQHALIKDVANRLAELTLADCLERFANDNCCVSPVLPIDRAVQSEHVSERGLVTAARNGGMQSLFPAIIDGEAPRTRPPLQPYTISDRGPDGATRPNTKEED
ncbi:MAG: alpha-methylacyl-CoA racemase [Hyphomicrobiaceae bacterium]|jgi:alpha-methylacyl-CoA racemase